MKPSNCWTPCVNCSSFISALPSITLRKENTSNEDEEHHHQQQQQQRNADVDEGFEMDIDVKEEEDDIEKKIVRHSKLDSGVDLERNNKFTKYCSSQELADETERTFKCVTNFSLREKLAVTDQDHNHEHVSSVDWMAMHSMSSSFAL